MHPTVTKELFALVLLLIFIGLFYAALPPMAYLFAYICVVLMFIALAVAMFGITDRDEREEKHRMVAAESGFVAGGVVIMFAIAKQAFLMQDVDAWLFIALITMLLVRILVRIHLDKKD